MAQLATTGLEKARLLDAPRLRATRNLFHLGFLLFLRDFQYRFKLAYFGYVWACLRPLLVGLPIILVGNQFNLGADDRLGISYPLFAFSGLILWQMFWDALFYPQWVMRRSRKLITRVRFPYKLVLIAGCFYVLFNVVFYTVLLGAALVIFGANPGPQIFFGVLSLPLLIASGLAIGALLAPTVLVYMDLRYALPLISSAVLWTIPVFYVTPQDGLLHMINKWNPVTYLVNTPRAWLTGGGVPETVLFFVSFAGFMALLVLSMRFYERAVRIGVDHVL